MIISAGSRTLGIAIFHNKRLMFYTSRHLAAENSNLHAILDGLQAVIHSTPVACVFLDGIRSPYSTAIASEIRRVVKSWDVGLKLLTDRPLSRKTVKEMIAILCGPYPELKFWFGGLNKGQRIYSTPIIRAVYLGFQHSRGP